MKKRIINLAAYFEMIAARRDVGRDFQRSQREERQRGNISLPELGFQRSTEAIFKGKKREHLIDKAASLMARWSCSPFEHEAVVRSTFRSGLCLAGETWRRSDDEAVEITREALRRMRAIRPTWDEGQPGYAIPKENCNRCGSPIDPLLAARERRYSFCSAECAKGALIDRNLNATRRESRMYADAWDVIQRVRNPAATCKQCGRGFRPVVRSNNKFCSKKCSAVSQRLPDVECKNCGKPFHSSQSNNPKRAYYCSFECKNAGGFTTKYERTCVWCFKSFVGKVPSAACCGPKCSTAYSNMKLGVRMNKRKRISPHIFDYVLRLAA